MVKAKTLYVCNACGASHPKWNGRCDACGEWNTLVEESDTPAQPGGLTRKALSKATQLDFVPLDNIQPDAPRHSTGMQELDRVLGGGIVPGSAVLIGGDPGIGKSTLLLQMCAQMGTSGISAAYITGEESTAQVQLRARRLGLEGAQVHLAAAHSLKEIIASLTSLRPKVVIIDSIQTLVHEMLDSAPGTVAQVRACTNELIRFAKRENVAVILVGHVTKDGQIAGPRVLEHMVDAVLYFEGDRGQLYRILRTVKNRFGATDEIGVFEMANQGLIEVQNPSALFLPERDTRVSGSAVFAGMEGSRPLLVEIQALVTPSGMANPRRAVVGWDNSRLSMLLAVLETRANMRFSDREVYVNVAGGLRIQEPAADLAVAAALVSALADTALPAACVFFGEVALSGDLRASPASEQRLKEAAKLGFERAAMPPLQAREGNTIQSSLDISLLQHVLELRTLLA